MSTFDNLPDHEAAGSFRPVPRVPSAPGPGTWTIIAVTHEGWVQPDPVRFPDLWVCCHAGRAVVALKQGTVTVPSHKITHVWLDEEATAEARRSIGKTGLHLSETLEKIGK
jgi:hypothetical protein